LGASCDQSDQKALPDPPPLDELSSPGLPPLDARFYRAETSDGAVHFIFSKSMARVVYDTFCATAVDPACDAFDAYFIEVSLGEPALTYNFAHRELRSTPWEDVPFVLTFGCISLPAGLQCGSGAHSYD